MSTTTTHDTTFVTPRTWSTNELVTGTIMNAHVRDQLTAIKTPASFVCVIDEAADYTTTGTTFADIDATDMKGTIITFGGIVQVGFSGTVRNNTAGGQVYLDIDVDGARVGGDDGLFVLGAAGVTSPPSSGTIIIPVLGLAAGSHTFKLQWKTNGTGTGTLYAGAGTSTFDIHPRFWGIELA